MFKHLDDTKYENAFKKLESERFTQQVRDPKSKRIQAFSDKNNTTTTTTQSTQTRAGLGNKTNTSTCTQSRSSSPIAKSETKNKKDPSAKKSIDHLFSADNKENLPVSKKCNLSTPCFPPTYMELSLLAMATTS